DVADPVADLGLLDAEGECLARDAEEFFDGRRDGADGNSEGVVADVAVVPDDDIERNDVTFAEDAFEGRDAMHHFIIHRDAGMGRVAARTVLVAITGAAGSEA